LRIGDKFIDEIDTAIRIREKVVLVLSENSIKSVWAEDEVTTACEEERKRGTTVLFQIRLDDAVVETKEAWAAKLRARDIGDFSQWKNYDDYHRTLQRVLRDLATPK
jgi:TIR domain